MGSLNNSTQLTLITPDTILPIYPALCSASGPTLTPPAPRNQTSSYTASTTSSQPLRRQNLIPKPYLAWLPPPPRSVRDQHAQSAQASVFFFFPAAQIETFVPEEGKHYHSLLSTLSTTSLKSQGSGLPSPSFLKGSASRRQTPFYVSLLCCLSCFLFSFSICMQNQRILTQIKSA